MADGRPINQKSGSLDRDQRLVSLPSDPGGGGGGGGDEDIYQNANVFQFSAAFPRSRSTVGAAPNKKKPMPAPKPADGRSSSTKPMADKSVAAPRTSTIEQVCGGTASKQAGSWGAAKPCHWQWSPAKTAESSRNSRDESRPAKSKVDRLENQNPVANGVGGKDQLYEKALMANPGPVENGYEETSVVDTWSLQPDDRQPRRSSITNSKRNDLAEPIYEEAAAVRLPVDKKTTPTARSAYEDPSAVNPKCLSAKEKLHVTTSVGNSAPKTLAAVVEPIYDDAETVQPTKVTTSKGTPLGKVPDQRSVKYSVEPIYDQAASVDLRHLPIGENTSHHPKLEMVDGCGEPLYEQAMLVDANRLPFNELKASIGGGRSVSTSMEEEPLYAEAEVVQRDRLQFAERPQHPKNPALPLSMKPDGAPPRSPLSNYPPQYEVPQAVMPRKDSDNVESSDEEEPAYFNLLLLRKSMNVCLRGSNTNSFLAKAKLEQKAKRLSMAAETVKRPINHGGIMVKVLPTILFTGRMSLAKVLVD